MARKTQPSEEEASLPQVINLTHTQAQQVEAELVRVHQSLVGRVDGGEVDLQQSAALQISAQNISAHTTSIASVQAKSFAMHESAVAVVRATQADLDGRAGLILAQSARMGAGSRSGLLVSNQVKTEQVRTSVLLARRVEGPVETVMDTRQVLLASLVAGIAVLLGQFLFRRKS